MAERRNTSSTLQRPYTFINMAMSADGKIAAAGSEFSRFGSPQDEKHLYQLRSQSDAIMSGASTIRKEQATLSLGKRTPTSAPTPQGPYRILVTAAGSLPVSAPFFTVSGPPILILTTQSIPKRQLDAYRKMADGIHQSDRSTLRWPAALDWLYRKWNIRRLLCEGGGQLNQSLLKEDVVDEIYLTICPYVIGGNAAPTIADGEAFPSLGQASSWSIASRKQRAKESFIRLTRKNDAGNHPATGRQK